MAEIRMDVGMHPEESHSSQVHTNKEYTILQVALNLATVCVISGIIIAVTYFITAPIAAQKSEMMEKEAMQSLVTNADEFTEIADKPDWFEAKKAGEVVAYIVPAKTKGYGGEISMLVAVSVDKTIINYQILSANETPGLGDNASKEPFRNQFVGKISNQLVVTKDPSNTDQIQAMTGATITSTAVTNAVKTAEDEVNAFVGGMEE